MIGGTEMEARMARGSGVQTGTDELDKDDARYWANATFTEKLQTITFLRECFYGPEATTGGIKPLKALPSLFLACGKYGLPTPANLYNEVPVSLFPGLELKVRPEDL